MLINLFNTVRAYGIPVSLKEFLDLLRALEKNLVFASWDDFYSLSRSILVKDEKYFDKFDKAFGVYFNGIENMDDILKTLIPEEWMRQQFEKELTKEELDKINDLGGLENLMREFTIFHLSLPIDYAESFTSYIITYFPKLEHSDG